MAEENSIVYVDLNRPSSVLSNYTFNQGKKFNAFTEKLVDRTPFVSMFELERQLGLEKLAEILATAGANNE